MRASGAHLADGVADDAADGDGEGDQQLQVPISWTSMLTVNFSDYFFFGGGTKILPATATPK
jgi:hypothetical protein